VDRQRDASFLGDPIDRFSCVTGDVVGCHADDLRSIWSLGDRAPGSDLTSASGGRAGERIRTNATCAAWAYDRLLQFST
jgi:hypothetical protein